MRERTSGGGPRGHTTRPGLRPLGLRVVVKKPTEADQTHFRALTPMHLSVPGPRSSHGCDKAAQGHAWVHWVVQKPVLPVGRAPYHQAHTGTCLHARGPTPSGEVPARLPQGHATTTWLYRDAAQWQRGGASELKGRAMRGLIRRADRSGMASPRRARRALKGAQAVCGSRPLTAASRH